MNFTALLKLHLGDCDWLTPHNFTQNVTIIFDLINKDYLVTIFYSMFISFLYMFRAAMGPSSGEITVFMRHLVLVILCG